MLYALTCVIVGFMVEGTSNLYSGSEACGGYAS